MWKDYSSGYIKNNRASGISVMIAAFISALLLSLLGSLFYNMWYYEVWQLKEEEGDWQGRLIGVITLEDLSLIENHANVDKVVIKDELPDGHQKVEEINATDKDQRAEKINASDRNQKSEETNASDRSQGAENINTPDGQQIVADVYFKNMRRIFKDLPQIAELAGLPMESVSYHYALLNLYLIRDASDTALRWVFPFILVVTLVACLSLVMVIHNAFAVSMNARIHQFGILSSIGATPGQIRTCLLQEAFMLCAVPIVAGSLLGIVICMGMIEAVNILMADVAGRLALPFCYHPLLLCLSLLAAVFTIGLSAWIPARKMSRLTPLEAIRNTGELQLKKKKKSRVLSRLFGVEGELAGNALKAQRRAMRTATLSLVFSFLAFSFMMCFLTITIVSQRETYFARYQDAWDVMVTVKDVAIDAFEQTEPVQQLPGVQSSVIYQKVEAKRMVAGEEISDEMRAIGGFENAPEQYVTAVSDGWLVNAPLVILDDAGFLEYCGQIGVEPRLDGAVILNQTMDITDPNFRQRRRLPYLTENSRTTTLRQSGQEETGVEIPVTAYTTRTPVLREEYGTLDFYELVHFIPLSLWREIKGQIGGTEEDIYIRILAEDRASSEELDGIEKEASQLLGQTFRIETENRLQEVEDNDRMFDGMKIVLSIFCILLAVIGIGNVFSNTLGFVRQRRREFARYLSVGLTPGGMKKIFCVEALVIAGRPVLITLPVTATAAIFFIKASYLDPMLFLREMPVVPILIFILAIFGFVALAYYLGARRVLGSSLTDALGDDTVL